MDAAGLSLKVLRVLPGRPREVFLFSGDIRK